MTLHEVSTLNQCQTINAQRLCLYDIGMKLKAPGQYNIGGTYINDEPDLWFFYNTSMCPGYKYLLNLFVCHRKPTILSVGISTGNELIHKNNVGGVSCSALPEVMTLKIVRAVEPDENNFITTFCFSEEDVNKMKNNTLHIPIIIFVHPKQVVLEDVLNKVKLEHDFSNLFVNKENTDFVIKTPSGKEHKVHKIVLAAHSPVLRSMLRNVKEDSMFIEILDNDLDLLLEFLYTGSIKALQKQNCMQLLEIADRFQLKNLFLLTQYTIGKQVTIENAVDIALLSEKYKLDEMQRNTFAYIKSHPQVLQTEGWRRLNDISLTKKLLEHLYRDNAINKI